MGEKRLWACPARGKTRCDPRFPVRSAPSRSGPGPGTVASFPPLLSPQTRARQSLPAKETGLSTRMIWRVLVAWEEPCSLYPPWNSPISAPTLHNSRRFAFSKLLPAGCRHLAGSVIVKCILSIALLKNPITWKARKSQKKKINGCIYHLLELFIVKQTPEIRRRDSFNTDRASHWPSGWMLKSSENNDLIWHLE